MSTGQRRSICHENLWASPSVWNRSMNDICAPAACKMLHSSGITVSLRVKPEGVVDSTFTVWSSSWG